MNLVSWLRGPSAHTASVTADTRRWIDTEQERHAELVARLRAEKDALREERDLIAADLTDERSITAELEQALDERRPAPAPGWLGRELRRRWFAASDELTDGERWEQVAETAIDAARGLWPSPGAKGPACQYCGADCSDGRSWDGGDLYACPSCAGRRASAPYHPTTRQAGCATAAVAGKPPRWAGEPPRGGDCAPGGGDLRPPSGGQNPQTSPGGEDTSSPQPGPSPSGDPYDRAKVDDPRVDPAEPGSRPACREESGGYSCTRPPGHSGQHVAEGFTDVMHVWPNADVVAKAERYGDEIGQRDRAAAIESAVRLLADHAILISLGPRSGSCRCGWQHDGTERSFIRHQAEQLAAVGLLGTVAPQDDCDCLACHLGGTGCHREGTP